MNSLFLAKEILFQQNALLDKLESEHGSTIYWPYRAMWKLELMSEYITLADGRSWLIGPDENNYTKAKVLISRREM